MEMRNDEIVPQQHAIQGARAGHELGAIRRGDDLVDQAVDGRVLDADDVGAGGRVGRGRTPVVALLVAGRERLAEGAHHHVEIEGLDALLELRVVHGAHRGVHAQPLQILREGQGDALEQRVAQQDLEGKRLARIPVDPLAVLDDPARLIEQCRGLAQIGAVVAAAVGRRQLEFLGEDLVGDLAAQGFQDLQLVRRRQARGSQFRIVEVALGAEVLAIEQGLVAPFEVEGIAQGLAQAAVLE